jgi:hypothetical protein
MFSDFVILSEGSPAFGEPESKDLYYRQAFAKIAVLRLVAALLAQDDRTSWAMI